MPKIAKNIYSILFATVLILTMISHGYGATTWYVDEHGDNQKSGSSGAPFQTVAHALGVASYGDTVSINDGIYSENQLVVPAGVSLTSTSKDNTKVRLQPKQSIGDTNPFVLLSSAQPGSVGNQSVSYLEISGVNGSNIARNGISVINRSNVRIHHCNIHDFKGSAYSNGVSVRSTEIPFTAKWWNYWPSDAQEVGNDANIDALWPKNPVENFELDHNTITRCGDRPNTNWIVPAVHPYNLKNSSIHDNTIDATGLDTECIFSTAAFLWNVDVYNNNLKMDLLSDRSSYIIELWVMRNGCEFYNNVANAGFSITYGKETSVHSNKIVFDTAHKQGIGIEFTFQSEGTVSNNFISNGPLYGIDSGSNAPGNGKGYIVKNTVIRNNVIHSTYGSGIAIFGKGQDKTTNANVAENIDIYHNTIDGIRNGVYSAIMIQQIEGTSGPAIIRDINVKNNLIVNCPTSSGVTMGSVQNLDINNNIFWNNGANSWSGSATKNTITGNPRLAGPSGQYSGYAISDDSIDTSAAVDAGLDLGLDIVVTGSAPDIGAIEVGSESPPWESGPLAPPVLYISSGN